MVKLKKKKNRFPLTLGRLRPFREMEGELIDLISYLNENIYFKGDHFIKIVLLLMRVIKNSENGRIISFEINDV